MNVRCALLHSLYDGVNISLIQYSYRFLILVRVIQGGPTTTVTILWKSVKPGLLHIILLKYRPNPLVILCSLSLPPFPMFIFVT